MNGSTTMTQRTLILTLSLVATLFGSGCSRGFDIKTPDGFAELDDAEGYRYRATSADGVVLAVRREKNEPKGSLDFWAAAVGNELTSRGYGKPAVESLKSQNGTAGKKLAFRTVKNGRPSVLWVAVFVSDDRVVVVETGGDADHFSQVESKVSAALSALVVG